MGNPIKAHSTNIKELARRFTEDMGFNVISVIKFDLWIIDQKMAKDPGTDNPKSVKYRAFVQDRNVALKRLRANGMNVPEGLRFDVRIVEAGVSYEVIEYLHGVANRSDSMGLNIRGYVEAQSGIHSKDGRKLKQLYNLNKDNKEIEDALMKTNFMQNEAMAMEREIKAITQRWDNASAAVHDEVRKLEARFELMAIEVDED